jgi:hypothetical protein
LVVVDVDPSDAPPNSFIDSNANPKVKTTKKERVGAHSLTHNTSRVKKACWSSKIWIRLNEKHVNYSYQYPQTKQQVG